MASITARLAKFSLAISSSPCRWRRSSRSTSRATAGSASRSEALWSRLIRLLLFDLRDPAAVPAAGEFGVQPCLEDLHALVFAHEARRKDQDIGVVVLPREPGDLGRPGHRRTHARMPVGGVRHAQPGAAEQHPAARARGARPVDATCVGEVRIVRGLGAVGAQIQRLVPQRPELLDQPLLELEAGVVRADGNDFSHWT